MKILVTGGLGFIGSNLVDRLVELGNDVFVIDDLSTGLEINRNAKAHYSILDISNYVKSDNSLKKLIGEHSIKVVYHLAGLSDVREAIKNPKSTYNVNFLSSVAISEACADSGVEKFVFASTSAVYGEPDYLPVDEKHKTVPQTPYGVSKLAVEQHLKCQSNITQMGIMVLRLPNVYGPRQRPDLEGGVVSIFNRKMTNLEVVTFYGDGNQTRDWVHVYDIVEALVKILSFDEAEFQIVSLGSEIENSLWDLFNHLRDLLNYELRPKLEDERKGDIKRIVMNRKKAENLLGWVPELDLKAGIRMLGA